MRRMLLAVLFTFPLAAAAQVRETIDVSVTNVDVVVTDARGNRVRGLTRDEFEVLEKGTRREVTNFAEYASGAAPGGAAAVPAPRRILLLFDNTTLTLANRRQAVAAARAFVAENIRPADRVMISSFGPNVARKLDWTSDPAAITAALDAVEREAQIGSIEYERRRVEQEIRQTIQDDDIGRASPRGSSVTFDQFLSLARIYAANAMRTYAQALSTLAGSLGSFGRTQEKKLAVVIGEGLPLHPGGEMFELVNTIKMAADAGSGSSRVRAGAKLAQPLTETATYDLTPNVRALAGSAFRRGIAVYTLNPGRNENAAGGVENLRITDNSADFARAAGQMSGYQLMANLTGGAAFLGARPPVAFAQIADDLGSYYSLGYRGDGPPEAGSVVVRSKSGYRVRLTPVAAKVPAEQIVEEAVMINHTTAPDSNDLQIRAQAAAAVTDGGKRRVSLKVLIPVRNLEFRNDGPEVVGAFNVYISTGDGRGNVSAVNKQTHLLRWPAEALPHLLGKDVTFAVDVVLEPGRDQISVGVMDQRSEKTGYDRISISG